MSRGLFGPSCSFKIEWHFLIRPPGTAEEESDRRARLSGFVTGKNGGGMGAYIKFCLLDTYFCHASLDMPLEVGDNCCDILHKTPQMSFFCWKRLTFYSNRNLFGGLRFSNRKFIVVDDVRNVGFQKAFFFLKSDWRLKLALVEV